MRPSYHGDHVAAESHLVLNALTSHAGRNDPSTEPLVPIAFDAAQITHPENRVNPRPGDPAMPLAATGQPHVAYTLRRDPGAPQGHNTSLVTGTRRGTPQVPVSLAVNQEISTGVDVAQTVTGSKGQPGAVAYLVDKEPGRPNAEGLSVRETDVAGTLTADGDPAEQNDRGLRIATPVGVRRLTPLECERLQGFPDGWTATSAGSPPGAPPTPARSPRRCASSGPSPSTRTSWFSSLGLVVNRG